MNMIYFMIKKLNENRAFLVMLCFLLAFGCKDSGNGDDTPTVKYTLTITQPINGTLSSDPAGIDCGSKTNACKAEFSKGTEVTLIAKGFSSGSTDLDYAPAAWQGACDKTEADQPCKLSMDANKTAGLMFGIDTDGDGVPDTGDVDDNNNGLIEIHDLDMFNHIQYSLAGTSYKTGADAEDNRDGAPDKATDDCTAATNSIYLCGYELMRDLDFAEGESYADGSVNTDWRPDDDDTSSATNAGFVGATDFAGIFEGNGYEISNLYSRHTDNSEASIGLFAKTTATATIRNVGVVNAKLYGGGRSDRIGALVGWNDGSISASYAKGGTVNGGAGDDYVGGLVGQDNNGSFIACHATGTANGGGGGDFVGGLVGSLTRSSVIASYAKGNVMVGFRIGGLVGENNNGTIIASYATGNVNGDASSTPGGLVGRNASTIIASYAIGNVNGSAGDDSVGGLVSINTASGSISASYATGNADGVDGTGDRVGILVGWNLIGGIITHSYAFGTAMNVDTAGDAGTAHPAGLVGTGAARANGLNGSGVGTVDASWNDVNQNTKNAWDFFSGGPPRLKYSDYDGSGDTYSCDMFPAKIPGTDTDLECGVSLLPNQPGRL